MAWPRQFRHLRTAAEASAPPRPRLSFPPPAQRLCSCFWCRAYIFARGIHTQTVIDVGKRRRHLIKRMIKHGWLVDQGFVPSGREHVCPRKHQEVDRPIVPIWPV